MSPLASRCTQFTVTVKWPSQQSRQGKAFQTDSTHLMLSERADTVKKVEFLFRAKRNIFGRFSMAVPGVVHEFTEHSEG